MSYLLPFSLKWREFKSRETERYWKKVSDGSLKHYAVVVVVVVDFYIQSRKQ